MIFLAVFFSLNLAKFETRATVVKFCVFSKLIYSLFYPFWHQSVKHISNRNTFFYKMISRMSASHSAQKCAPSKYKRNSRELRPILYFSVVWTDATLFIYFQILISVNKPCDLETKSFQTTYVSTSLASFLYKAYASYIYPT